MYQQLAYAFRDISTYVYVYVQNMIYAYSVPFLKVKQIFYALLYLYLYMYV